MQRMRKISEVAVCGTTRYSREMLERQRVTKARLPRDAEMEEEGESSTMEMSISPPTKQKSSTPHHTEAAKDPIPIPVDTGSEGTDAEGREETEEHEPDEGLKPTESDEDFIVCDEEVEYESEEDILEQHETALEQKRAKRKRDALIQSGTSTTVSSLTSLLAIQEVVAEHDSDVLFGMRAAAGPSKTAAPSETSYLFPDETDLTEICSAAGPAKHPFLSRFGQTAQMTVAEILCSLKYWDMRRARDTSESDPDQFEEVGLERVILRGVARSKRSKSHRRRAASPQSSESEEDAAAQAAPPSLKPTEDMATGLALGRVQLSTLKHMYRRTYENITNEHGRPLKIGLLYAGPDSTPRQTFYRILGASYREVYDMKPLHLHDHPDTYPLHFSIPRGAFHQAVQTSIKYLKDALFQQTERRQEPSTTPEEATKAEAKATTLAHAHLLTHNDTYRGYAKFLYNLTGVETADTSLIKNPKKHSRLHDLMCALESAQLEYVVESVQLPSPSLLRSLHKVIAEIPPFAGETGAALFDEFISIDSNGDLLAYYAVIQSAVTMSNGLYQARTHQNIRADTEMLQKAKWAMQSKLREFFQQRGITYGRPKEGVPAERMWHGHKN